MNEKKVLVLGAAILVVLGAALPFVLKKTPTMSPQLAVPGPTTSEPPMAISQSGVSLSSEKVNALPKDHPTILDDPTLAGAQSMPKDHPSSEDPASLATLGESYLEQQNYEAAIPYLRRSLEKRQDAGVMLSLAAALRQTGQTAESYQMLMHSLELKPDSIEARYYLGLLQQYDLGDFTSAIQTFEDLMPSLPKDLAPEAQRNIDYMKRVRTRLLEDAKSQTRPQEAQPAPALPAEHQSPALPVEQPTPGL